MLYTHRDNHFISENVKVAIIDLGTNSARLYIYKSAKRRPFQRILRVKAPAKLGEGLFNSGLLEDSAVERTLKIFDEFYSIIKKHDVDLIQVVATSALREARDRKRVVNPIKEKYDIDIKVISGKEEARLIAKGVIHTLKLEDPDYLLIDIGGGSTEVSIISNNKIIFSESLPLGSSRNQQTFLHHIPPVQRVPGKGIQAMRDNIQEILNKTVPKECIKRIPMVIGTSGAIRAYRRVVSNKSDKQVFLVSGLRSLLSDMKNMSREELLHVPRLEAKRTDTILSAGIILDEICRFFNSQYIYASSVSLKDGILADLEKKHN